MKRRFIIFLAIFYLAFGIVLAFSAEEKKAEKEKTENEIQMKADKLLFFEKENLIKLVGNVKFSHTDMVITTPYAEFNKKTGIGNLTGGVKMTQPESVMTCDRMKIFYLQKKGILTGNVKAVTTKPLGGQKGGTGKTVTTLTCNELEYYWVKKEGFARGNVFVEQKSQRAKADRAHYKGDKNYITLVGNVRFERGSNDWLECREAEVDMVNETFIAKGNVEGNFIMQEEKKEEKTPEETAKKPAPMDNKLLRPEYPLDERVKMEKKTVLSGEKN